VFLTYRGSAAIDQLVAAAVANDPLFETDAFVGAFDAVEKFYIADGHHRAASAYRSRQQFREQNPNHDGSENYNWFLTVLFPAEQLNILAYNRVVADLNELSTDQLLTKLGEIGTLTETSEKVPGSVGEVSVYVAGKWYSLRFPGELLQQSDPVARLDVALLESQVLNPILGITDVRTDARIDFVGGIRGTDELERRVDQAGGAAFSMFPTSIEQLMDTADSSDVMPPKSTWFEPKLRSGLFVHLLK